MEGMDLGGLNLDQAGSYAFGEVDADSASESDVVL